MGERGNAAISSMTAGKDNRTAASSSSTTSMAEDHGDKRAPTALPGIHHSFPSSHVSSDFPSYSHIPHGSPTSPRNPRAPRRISTRGVGEINHINNHNHNNNNVPSTSASPSRRPTNKRMHEDFVNMNEQLRADAEDDDLDDGHQDEPPPKKRMGRRKIKIEFIQDKNKRQITFSKRKAGLMKKAYELTTLTGTQALLLVASETGHVYTFATPKLQPFVTLQNGKQLIQRCLSTPEPDPSQSSLNAELPDPMIPYELTLTSMLNAANHMTNNIDIPPHPHAPTPHIAAIGQQRNNIIGPLAPPLYGSLPASILVAGRQVPVRSQSQVKALQEMCKTWGDIAVCIPTNINDHVVCGYKIAEVNAERVSTHGPITAEQLRSHLHKCESEFPEQRVKNIIGADLSPKAELYLAGMGANAAASLVFGVYSHGDEQLLDKPPMVVGISCAVVNHEDGMFHKVSIDPDAHSRRLDLAKELDGPKAYYLVSTSQPAPPLHTLPPPHHPHHLQHP